MHLSSMRFRFCFQSPAPHFKRFRNKISRGCNDLEFSSARKSRRRFIFRLLGISHVATHSLFLTMLCVCCIYFRPDLLDRRTFCVTINPNSSCCNVKGRKKTQCPTLAVYFHKSNQSLLFCSTSILFKGDS